MNENIRSELEDLLEKLEDQLYKLDTYVEENSEIEESVWKQIDQLIINANVTISKIKYLAKYS